MTSSTFISFDKIVLMCVRTICHFFSLQKQKYIGYAYDPDCMYINGSGRDYYEFYIQLNRCGTLGKNAISEKSRENPTVRISIISFDFLFVLFVFFLVIFNSTFHFIFIEFHVEYNYRTI